MRRISGLLKDKAISSLRRATAAFNGVDGKRAVYGEWPLLPRPPDSRRRHRPSTLSKLRALWREEDGALAALNNALRIVEEFGRPQRVAA